MNNLNTKRGSHTVHNQAAVQYTLLHSRRSLRMLAGLVVLLLGSTLHAATLTRTSSFTYNATTGLLETESIEPDNTALRLDTSYTYDSFGNKITATVSGSGIVTRTTTTTYDAQGRFPVTTTNALGHSETRVFDARFGMVTQVTGSNGLVSSFAFDTWGRSTTESGPDGVVTTSQRGTCPATGCPTLAAYYITVSKTGAPTITAYFDKFNRELRIQSVGFSGTNILKDTAYDALGRVASASRSYYTGASIAWSNFTYDLLNRVLTDTAPSGGVTTYTYKGYTTTVTDALSHSRTSVKNSQGQLISATDANNKTVSYAYNPFGNLLTTTDAATNVIILTYDLRGRKTGMNDPDMGLWSYTYDVLGELITQTDAKGQITTNTYDKLGRVLTRNEPDLVTTWTYDTATKGIGKLASTSTSNGQTRTFTYDSLGRLSNTITTPGTGATALVVSTSYDSYGRVDSQTNPAGIQVQNIYNTNGYLSQVRNASSLQVYWTATALSADGQLTGGTFGNGVVESRTLDNLGRTTAVNATHTLGTVTALGYTYDAVGNLTIRTDTTQNLTETNGYDSINRLTSVTSSNPNQVAKLYFYDALGNISSKSDAGTYTYAALRANGTNRPHAVSSVNGSWNTSFSYDANGNITSGGDRTFTYTSFNLPASINRTVPNTGTTTILYGADHERAKVTEPDGTVTVTLNPRLDSGAHYDQRTYSNGVVENVNYIYAGYRPIGIYTTNFNGVNGTNTLRYLHADAQGSIVALSESTGVGGTVTAGTNPNAVAVNPTTNKSYVANYGNASVTVIDGTTNTTSTIATGTNPYAIAVNPATNKIYVANYGNNNVTVIDGATNSTTTVVVGSNPQAVAVNPATNKIYVANYGSNNVTVIDGATNSTTTVVVGSNPQAVAVNSITNKIYVANYGSNNVTVIEGITNSTTTVAVGNYLSAIAVNSNTNKIYVPFSVYTAYYDFTRHILVSYLTGYVSVIDGATNITTRVTVGSNPQAIAVNSNTNKIYVANYGSNNVSVINGATNTATTVATGINPRAIAVNSNTNKIYVANYGSNNVSVINGATNTATTVATGTNPRAIVVNLANNNVYVVNYGSSNVTVIAASSQIVAERLAYDAWGKRRNPNGTDDNNNNLQAINTMHGYTGHMHLEDAGLIHMNGRVYDPRLGRFLEADPYIQAHGNLQSFNRYTYVMNNPFMYTDPSGYFSLKNEVRNATIKVMSEAGNIPYVGGIAQVGLLTTTFGQAYGWATGDWKSIGRAFETSAILAATVWAGGAAWGAFDSTVGFACVTAETYATTAGIYIAESAAISYASSFATAKVYGASDAEARHGAVLSAKRGAVTAPMRIGFKYMADNTDKLSRATGNTEHDPNTGELDTIGDHPNALGVDAQIISPEGSPRFYDNWLGGYVRTAINAVSKVHDYMGSWAEDANGLYTAPIPDSLYQTLNWVGMPFAAAYTYKAYGSPISGLNDLITN